MKELKQSFEYILNLDVASLLKSDVIDQEIIHQSKVIGSGGETKISDKLQYLLEHDDAFKIKFEKFLRNCQYVFIYDEIITANQVIKSKNPRETYRSFAYYESYLGTIKAEIEGGNLTKGDKIIFIGSGPLPITLIQLYEHYGIESIGIEIIPEVAALSRQLISSLGLSDKIEIVTGNHFSIKSAKDIKHIIVALAAEPKDEILQWLKTVISKDTSVSYRFEEYEDKAEKLKDLFVFQERKYKEFDGYTTTKIIKPAPPSRNIIAIVKPSLN